SQKTCPECWKTFSDPLALAKHQRVHEETQKIGKSMMESPKIGKSLESQKIGKSLDKSQEICSKCGKTFGDPSALAKHQRVHENSQKIGKSLVESPKIGKSLVESQK
ncbi:Z286A protein, partial [Setophaga kirtlandii]|nr:Z286A protein [Setophaga kirtlandii]